MEEEIPNAIWQNSGRRGDGRLLRGEGTVSKQFQPNKRSLEMAEQWRSQQVVLNYCIIIMVIIVIVLWYFLLLFFFHC